MTNVRGARISLAALVAACAGVVVAIGAPSLLSLHGVRSAPEPVRVAPERVVAVSVPAAGDLEAEARRALAIRRVDGASPEDGGRIAIAAEAGTASEAHLVEPAPPAGELEVLVRSADRAVHGWVALQPVATNDVTVPFDRRQSTEAVLEDGIARFHDVPRGVLLVGVHVGSDPAHRVLWVNSRVRGARLELELGSAGLHGRIRSAYGAPVEGARVVVSGRHGTVVASSGADGSYDAGEHLPAGRYTVEVAGTADARSFPRRNVDLAPGATRDVSFGPGSDLSRWSGRVLAPGGDLVRAGDGLDERAVQLVARNGSGVTLDVDVVDGAIDQWLERGVYALRAGSKAHERLPTARLRDPRGASGPEPDAIDLSGDLVRDVYLSGFVLRGRVEPPRDGSASISLSGDRSLPELRAAIDAEGGFRFVGLAPGDYELRWATGGAETVAIEPHGPIEVVLDLTRSSRTRSSGDPTDRRR